MVAGGDHAAKKPLFEVSFTVDFKTDSSVEIDKFMVFRLRVNCWSWQVKIIDIEKDLLN